MSRTASQPKPKSKGKGGGGTVASATTRRTTKPGTVRPTRQQKRRPSRATTKRIVGGPMVQAGIVHHIPTQLECQEAFLSAYARLGVISEACREARIGRQTHYNWLENDPDYVERFRLAHETSVDMAEAELRRRGIEGYDKPIYQGGELVGYVREYSDACLIFYLKGRRGDIFKERVDTTINTVQPVVVYVPENHRQLSGPEAVIPESAPESVVDGEFTVDLGDNGRGDASCP